MNATMDRDAKRAAATELLESFCTAEDVTAWARTRRWLHRFSLTNQLLLHCQVSQRDAEGVEDYFPIQAAWRWKNAGYHPAKGAKALYVWAPVKLKKDADGSWLCGVCRQRAHGPRCAEGHPRKTVFTLKPVFGACQVVSFETGERPPRPPEPEPLTGDSHAHLIGRLSDWAVDEGLVSAVEFHGAHKDAHIAAGAGGYYSASKRLIVVKDGVPPNQQAATLIHEIAHACGVGYDTYGRGDAEAIVESAAMLACAALGLDTSVRSPAYVARWAGSEGEAPHAVLQRHLKVIDELAKRIERAASPPEEAK